MSRSVRAAATVVGAILLLAGCGDSTDVPESPFAGEGADVDVDTADLRAQRKAADIPDCPGAVQTAPAAAEGGLPELTLPCLGGGPDVDLSTLRGPLVVNLWAQWCVPCRAELPYFARLHDSGVAVLGVNFQDTQPDQALSLAADSGVSFASVADIDGTLRAPLRVVGMPTTLFVDARGKVTATVAQEFSSYEQLAAAVRAHLGVRA